MPRTLPRPAKVRRVTLVDRIAHRIHEIRGHRVMLDSDLADLYGVETRVLVQGVKRNIARFPKDFLFQLTRPEFHRLRSQFVISNGRGGLRRPPYAFTEHGAVMLASVLNSPVAVATSVHVVRAFLRLRQIAVKYKELARKVLSLERRCDAQFKAVFDAIRAIMDPPEPKKGRVLGFQARKERPASDPMVPSARRRLRRRPAAR